MNAIVAGPNIRQFHDPRMDRYVDFAHKFTGDDMGMRIAPSERVSVVAPENREALLRELREDPHTTVMGWYLPDFDQAAVSALPDLGNPQNATVQLVSRITHELAHSASHDLNEHPFYYEAHAGLVEHELLATLERMGKRPAVGDHILERAGVRLVVPGEYRYFHNPNSSSVNGTPGLIAAHALSLVQHVGAPTAAEYLAASRPGGGDSYRMMGTALDSLRPGLRRQVESYPETTEGILQASAAVQREAARQGIPLNLK